MQVQRFRKFLVSQIPRVFLSLRRVSIHSHVWAFEKVLFLLEVGCWCKPAATTVVHLSLLANSIYKPTLVNNNQDTTRLVLVAQPFALLKLQTNSRIDNEDIFGYLLYIKSVFESAPDLKCI